MSTTRRGFFITFEGNDGSGKSTQLRMLAERLRTLGHKVLETAEPGGTPIGSQIRRVLLDPANWEMRPTTELLLMFAARAQNVEQWILPALERDEIVLSDRFTDSSLAYQGVGRSLGTKVVLELHRIACRGLSPDVTIIVDIDPEAGLARAHGRNTKRAETSEPSESRIDEDAIEFHLKVRDAYKAFAANEPARFRVVDGGSPVEAIAENVWAAVQPLLPR